MKARFALAAGFSLSLCLWTLESRADDTSLEGLLAQEVVTSVSKSAESSQDAPALTRSISAEDIRRYGMTSIAEALDFLGVGVHVEHALNHSELTARGVGFAGDGGNHTLLLVDGQIVNEALLGSAPIDQRLGIPLEMVDHIELVLGPGSAMYGTSAVMAVVSVVTKSAGTMKGYHAVAEAGAVGTLRATATTGQAFDLFGKRSELTAGLSYFRKQSSIRIDQQTLGVDPVTKQPVTWGGGEVNDAFRQSVPGLRLRFVRDGLEVSARATVADAGDPAGFSEFNLRDAGTVERRGSLSVAQRFALGRFGDLTATVYGQGYASEMRLLIARRTQCIFADVSLCDYRVREGANRIGADVRTQLDWLQDGRLVTALGTSASIDHVNADAVAADYASGRSLAIPTPWIDVDSVLNVAANGQQTLRPFSWAEVIAGGRIDWRKINDANHAEVLVIPPVLTPRLALAVRPWSGATTKLMYSEAFRAPNPYEIDASGQALIRAGALPPEKARSVEATFEQRIDAHRLMAGVFRTEYEGIINRALLTEDEQRAAFLAGLTPLPPDAHAPVFQFRSEKAIETHGFNVGVDGAFLGQRLHYGATFTGTVARGDRSESVPIAPQWFGNARVAYDLGGKLPTAALATTFAGSTASDHTYDPGYKLITYAPASLEIRATLTGQVPGVKGLSYRLIVAHQRQGETPFAVGPSLRAITGFERVSLTPTQPWNALLGLQYDFGD